MSRASLIPVVASACAALAALVGLAGACDSSLNLGDGVLDGAADGDAGFRAFEAGTPTCASACDRMIGCGYGRPDQRDACLSDCMQRGRSSDLECIMKTDCPDIFRVCSGAGDASIPDIFDASAFEAQAAIEDCQGACNRFQFFDCIDASELATCRGLCETVSSAKRGTFNACASGASNCPKRRDCFAVLQQ